MQKFPTRPWDLNGPINLLLWEETTRKVLALSIRVHAWKKPHAGNATFLKTVTVFFCSAFNSLKDKKKRSYLLFQLMIATFGQLSLIIIYST